MTILMLLLTITGGLSFAVQSPTNTTLSGYVGNFRAAAVSFGGGCLVLLVMTLFLGPDMSRLSDAEPWMLVGGAYGVFAVISVIFTAPVLGIALTLMVNMLGQLIMGAFVDEFGWFRADVLPVGPLRLLGILLVAAGIIVVCRGMEGREGAGGNRMAMLIFAFAAGVSGAVQSPTNVAVSELVGQIGASFFNFTEGFLLSLILVIIMRRTRYARMGIAEHLPKQTRIRPWMLLGGIYGSFGVLTNIIATPHLGVTLMVSALMLGQLLGGVLIDTFGLLRVRKLRLNRWRLAGVLLIAVGVAVVTAAKMM